MPRAPKAIKRPIGNPQKEIDWDMVDDWLISGCPGTKIAQALGICNDTLYDRCEKDRGVIWSVYVQQKRANGDALLHKVQFKKAMEGDNTLLVWLGKVRLEQRETSEISIAPDTVAAYNKILNQVENMQEERKKVKEEVVHVRLKEDDSSSEL